MTRSKRENRPAVEEKLSPTGFRRGAARRGAGAAIKRLAAVICFRGDLDGVRLASDAFIVIVS